MKKTKAVSLSFCAKSYAEKTLQTQNKQSFKTQLTPVFKHFDFQQFFSTTQLFATTILHNDMAKFFNILTSHLSHLNIATQFAN